jgi:hypothetical protein
MSTTSDIVSDFVMNTCYLNPQPNMNKLLWWWTMMTEGDDCSVTGSISELYIEPILPCIRDVDITRVYPFALAVWSRCQVPRNLPPMYEDTVDVCEIIDAESPGYVYLPFIGQLYKNKSTRTRIRVQNVGKSSR